MKKKAKIKNLLVLILLLIFNTYAWFIYNSKVDTDIDVHVGSWSVSFNFNDGSSSTQMDVDITDAYPGMEDYERVINVYNDGDTDASLEYEIESIRIMDTIYETSDSVSSEDLIEQISESYPFKIEVEVDENEEKNEDTNCIGSYTIKMTWPYESRR